jgi:hypothetical protein
MNTQQKKKNDPIKFMKACEEDITIDKKWNMDTIRAEFDKLMTQVNYKNNYNLLILNINNKLVVDIRVNIFLENELNAKALMSDADKISMFFWKINQD